MAFDFGSAMESTNAIDSQFELNKSMKVLTAAIFGFSKRADKSFLNIRGRKSAAEKINGGSVGVAIDKSSLKVQSEIVGKLDEVLDKMKDLSMGANADNLSAKILLLNKEQLQNAYGTLGFLERLGEWGSKKAKVASVGMQSIVSVLVGFAEKIKANEKSFMKMSEIMGNFNNSIMGLGKTLALLGVGVIGLALAAVIFTAVGVKGFLMMIATVIALAVAIRFANMISGDSGGDDSGLALSLMGMGVGVIALAIAGLIFQQVGWKGMLMVVLTVMALGLAIGLMNKISGGNNGNFGESIIMLALSVGILALSIWAWNKLVPSMDMMLAPALAIGALVAILALVGERGDSMLKASFSLIVASISLIILGYAIKQFEGVSYDAMLKAGLAVAGLTLSLVVLGNMGAQAILGGVSLMIGSIAMVILASALNSMAGVSTESLIQLGLFTVGLGAVLVLLGSLPQSILGAGALLLGGVALVIIASALNKMKGTDPMMLVTVGLGIVGLGASFVLLGNPLTLPFLLAGIAAALGISTSVAVVASALAKIKNAGVTEEDAKMASNMIGGLISSMADVFEKNSDKLWDIKMGLWAISDLGNVISTIGIGVANLANLSVTEYEVRDGKLVAKNVRQLNEGDFKMAGISLGKIVSAVSDPLAAIGAKTSGSWLFSSNPVADGIEAVSGLGSVISTIAEGVSNMANLKFTTYGIKDGKVVATGIRSMNNGDFARVGANINTIIDSVKSPLEAIGEQAGFLTDSALGKGIEQVTDLGGIMTSIAEGTLGMANMSFTTYKVVNGELVADKVIKVTDAHIAQVGVNFGKIVNALRSPIEAIGADSGMFTDGDFKNGLDALAGLGDVITPIVSLVETMSSLGEGSGTAEGAGKMVGTILKDISASLDMAKGLNFDKTALTIIGSTMREINADLNEFNLVAKAFDNMANSMEKLNNQLSPEKFQRIMDVTKSVKEMADGELNENFQRLLDQVLDRLAGAMEGINKTMAMGSKVPKVKPITVVQGGTKTAEASPTGSNETTVGTGMNTEMMETLLSEIRDLVGGTLQVNMQTSDY